MLSVKVQSEELKGFEVSFGNLTFIAFIKCSVKAEGC